MSKCSYLILVCLTVTSAAGQVEDQHGHGEHHSLYAGQESSGIAALSPKELADLTSGAGMGLARAAELNSYPGPKHVLELATELDLSSEQLARTEELRLEVLGEAKRVGEAIVAKERILNRRFAHRHLDESTLRELTGEISDLYGELRFVHLLAHLRLASVLTAEQIDAYDALRGYGSQER